MFVAGRRIYDWAVLQAYIDWGHGYKACHRRFGIAHATWVKAIRRGDLRARLRSTPYPDRRRSYDWAAIQAYYDEGRSYRQTRAHFGFSAATWAKAINRGELKPRPQAMPIARLLATSQSRASVKRRLLNAGILKNRCDWCGLSQWRGRPLSIQIDHINGKRDDHRLENLRMLCPNCHSQTETFAAKNNRKITMVPDGEIGITSDSGSEIWGSSPCPGD